MFHPILKRKFEYFTNYFETAFKNKNRSFAQSIVLYGQDTAAQYYLAMDIARQLNCLKADENNSAYDCGCLNCSWIRNNQHPAVLTFSKNDNKPSDDDSKTVISVKQTQKLNESLINSSEYYRVFIFCDSEKAVPNDIEQKRLLEFDGLNFKFPQEKWLPRPLTRDVLPAAAANSMLKSVEEPPERTLFIFLTTDREDIIETIISRSQSFYIPSLNNEIFETTDIQKALSDYPNFQKKDVLHLSAALLTAAEADGKELSDVLDSMEYYFVQMIKSNFENKVLVQKIKKDILSIQTAKKQIEANIKPRQVFDNLFFSFI